MVEGFVLWLENRKTFLQSLQRAGVPFQKETIIHPFSACIEYKLALNMQSIFKALNWGNLTVSKLPSAGSELEVNTVGSNPG